MLGLRLPALQATDRTSAAAAETTPREESAPAWRMEAEEPAAGEGPDSESQPLPAAGPSSNYAPNQENFKPEPAEAEPEARPPEEAPAGKIICSECCKPINDRYIMRLLRSAGRQQQATSGAEGTRESHYHENCLKCHNCRCLLDKSCFVRGSKLLCRRDYFGNSQSQSEPAKAARCIACSQPLGAGELVMRVDSNRSVYHLACFGCFLCQRPLRKGDRYQILDNGRVLCTQHGGQLQAQPTPPCEAQFGSNFESITPNHFNASSEQYHNQAPFNVIQRPGRTGQSLLTQQPVEQLEMLGPAEEQLCLANRYFLGRGLETGSQKRLELNGRGPQHSPLLSLSGVVDSLPVGSQRLGQDEEGGRLPASSPDAKNAQTHLTRKPAMTANKSPSQRAAGAGKSRSSKTAGLGQPPTGSGSQLQQRQPTGCVLAPGGRIDGRRGPKRPRTILTTSQRRAFKNSFDLSQKPCRKVREALAKETGLSVRIVQVWFQNQRAKLKKIQRKQMPQGLPGAPLSGSPRNGNSLGQQQQGLHLQQQQTHQHHAHQHQLQHHQALHQNQQMAGPPAADFMQSGLLLTNQQQQAQPQQLLCPMGSSPAAGQSQQQYQLAPARPPEAPKLLRRAPNQNRGSHESEGETSRSMSGLESEDEEESDELDEEDDEEDDEEEEEDDEDDEEEEEEEEERNCDSDEPQMIDAAAKRKRRPSPGRSSLLAGTGEQPELFGPNGFEINSTDDNRK